MSTILLPPLVAIADKSTITAVAAGAPVVMRGAWRYWPALVAKPIPLHGVFGLRL